jgi:hypothetical protein
MGSGGLTPQQLNRASEASAFDKGPGHPFSEYMTKVTREATVAWPIGSHGPPRGAMLMVFNEIQKRVPCVITLSGTRKKSGIQFSFEYDLQHMQKALQIINFYVLGVVKGDKVTIEIEADAFIDKEIIDSMADIIKACFEDEKVDFTDTKAREENRFATTIARESYAYNVAELFPTPISEDIRLEEEYRDIIDRKNAQDKDRLDIERERAVAEDLRDDIIGLPIDPGTRDQKFIIAMGTGWIPGYDDRRVDRYEDINELMILTRRLCEKSGSIFIDASDDNLESEIAARKAVKGFENAKVIVLAKEDTIREKLKGLHGDPNACLVGVDNSGISITDYIQVVEMVGLALNSALHPDVSPKSDFVGAVKRGGFWVLIPRPLRHDTTGLIEAYKAQQYA